MPSIPLEPAFPYADRVAWLYRRAFARSPGNAAALDLPCDSGAILISAESIATRRRHGRKNRHAGTIGIFAGFRDFSHDRDRPVFCDLHIDAGGAQYLLVQQDIRTLSLKLARKSVVSGKSVSVGVDIG